MTAATLALKGEIPLIQQLLIYRVCDWDRSRPSFSGNPHGPLVKPDDTVMMLYCPDAPLRSSPRLVPLHADSHADLPPAFVAVGDHDPLRYSGVVYAEAFEKAGVPVVLARGEGLIHGYMRAMESCTNSNARLRKLTA